MPLTPADILNIGPGPDQNHFNVGIGRPDGHTDYGMSKLTDRPGFRTTPDGKGVEFSARADAKTTSKKTKHGRSELRELNADGSKAEWDGRKGYHRLSWTARVMRAPDGRSWICFGQLHDAKSDLVRLQTEGSKGSVKLVARNTPPGSDKETTRTIRAEYRFGDPIVCDLDIAGGKGTIWLDGVQVGTFPAGTTGIYGKVGAYLQFNASQVPASETGVVVISDLRCQHSTTPLPPVDRSTPAPDPEPQPEPTNRTVMLIRHGEKPESEDDHTLSARGRERASKLAWLFTRNPNPLGLPRPERLFASKGDTASMRMVQTLQPTSRALGLPISSQFDSEEQIDETANWLEVQPGVTLACLEREAILGVARRLGPISAGVVPDIEEWPPDRFDLFWIFEQQPDGTWHFRQVGQMLMIPGDRPIGIS